MNLERDAFIKNGWKQFCVLNPEDNELCSKHAHINVDGQTHLLVISQTCDLVNDDTSKEPFFEVACIRKLEAEPNLMNAHGKNSRRFELSLTINGISANYYLLAHERFVVRRELLANLSPYDCIEDQLIRDELTKWIIARYSRTAFPESFVQRLRPKLSKIEKVIKKLNLIEGLYIQISPFDELSEGESYDVSIILLMEGDDFDDKSKYDEYSEYRKQFEDAILQCNGLSIKSVDLVSNEQITIKELQGYAYWDYSYLSYRDPSAHALPK